jgi:uncharacterized peroxidase-related enzyme
MSRIEALSPENASELSRELLEEVRKQLGVIPNLFKVLAHSPAALSFYMGQTAALAGGVLDRKLREQLAVRTAGLNHCDYCASAHTYLGQRAGIPQTELAQNLEGAASDPKTQAALDFARIVVEQRGTVDDVALKEVRNAGFSEAEIVEILAHVGMNIFTNYVNHIAQTELDFPRVATSRS